MIMTPGTNEQVFIPLFLFLPKCYESQAFLRESQAFLLKCSIGFADAISGETSHGFPRSPILLSVQSKNSSQREQSGFAMKRTSNGVSALRSCLSGKRYGIREDAVSLDDPSFPYYGSRNGQKDAAAICGSRKQVWDTLRGVLFL